MAARSISRIAPRNARCHAPGRSLRGPPRHARAAATSCTQCARARRCLVAAESEESSTCCRRGMQPVCFGGTLCACQRCPRASRGGARALRRRAAAGDRPRGACVVRHRARPRSRDDAQRVGVGARLRHGSYRALLHEGGAARVSRRTLALWRAFFGLSESNARRRPHPGSSRRSGRTDAASAVATFYLAAGRRWPCATAIAARSTSTSFGGRVRRSGAPDRLDASVPVTTWLPSGPTRCTSASAG